jgi:hypothetical protein
MNKFKNYLNSLVTEEVHDELKKVINNTPTKKLRPAIKKAAKALKDSGQDAGIDNRYPAGSSRMYLKETAPAKVSVDGQEHHLTVGTKVAINAQLDKHHNKDEHDGLSLGKLQNQQEAGDWYVNRAYRVLRESDDSTPSHRKYETNEDGIFPPQLDHDEKEHKWTRVAHCGDITGPKFRELTKTKDFPEGISHQDFMSNLVRFHEKNNGKYYKGHDSYEAKMDKLSDHPLVQKFNDYLGNTGNPPHDFSLNNLGVFKHPNGTEHIVARDHGYTTAVEHAYANARSQAWKK